MLFIQLYQLNCIESTTVFRVLCDSLVRCLRHGCRIQAPMDGFTASLSMDYATLGSATKSCQTKP
ncbi:hypothetical protein QWZ13_07170 [Reinekea marina]|uniref:hypothetical protein n=1 Tax=Reinekea marina TaxID=1310421 RepID=UPI0025B61BBC|nr:hypothetical protein [Reinekea marina]MDN3648693.1 hypothetical protein [Reinekea marina]